MKFGPYLSIVVLSWIYELMSNGSVVQKVYREKNLQWNANDVLSFCIRKSSGPQVYNQMRNTTKIPDDFLEPASTNYLQKLFPRRHAFSEANKADRLLGTLIECIPLVICAMIGGWQGRHIVMLW
jgi:hypothetical protein